MKDCEIPGCKKYEGCMGAVNCPKKQAGSENSDLLSSDILKKRLRYQGRQYQSGMQSRGGNTTAPHMLIQAADRIDILEAALRDLLNDCINFDGGKLTDCIMKQAFDALKG